MTLEYPGLPSGLDGLRILHVSDLHARRPRERLDEILLAVEQFDHDLLLVTGDSMTRPGDEPFAADYLSRLVGASQARLGKAGVWGNHDTPLLRDKLRGTGIRWLENAAWHVPEADLTLLGVNCTFHEVRGWSGDLAAALLDDARQPAGDSPRFRILLAHLPSWLPPAAACGIPLVLSGHTHAGQWRLPTGHPIYNATPDWPLRLSSGLIHWGETRCVVSPGLGEVGINLRLFCPPGIPLITLRPASA